MNTSDSDTLFLIDLTFFHILLQSLGRERFQTTLDLYEAHWGGRLKEARSLPVTGRIEMVHGLVGASRNMGLKGMADQAADIENAMKQHSSPAPQQLKEWQASLEGLFQRTLEAARHEVQHLEQGL